MTEPAKDEAELMERVAHVAMGAKQPEPICVNALTVKCQ